MLKTFDPQLTQKLLAWFDRQARDLPWRDAPCGARDPYRVWLAEIMLQQTQVAAVIPYYETFLAKWPDVKALAQADDGEVMAAWAGLGYYARARNMLKCARHVAEQRQGAFPRAEQDLLDLPGVGPYTAAAIAAIAFNTDAAPVDGNVIRVLGRLHALEAVMPAGKGEVARLALELLPSGRGGDFAEALMDLGATVCRPKNPDCPTCPWAGGCRALALGDPAAYPKKASKKPRPTRYGWAYWVERADGHVLLERRPDKGLLGGMLGVPTTAWSEERIDAEDAAKSWGADTWEALPGTVAHTFTHFHLELGVLRVYAADLPSGLWRAPDALAELGLPTLMDKVARLASQGSPD